MKHYIRTDKPLSKSDAFFHASEEELRVLCLITDAGEPLSAEELVTLARLEGIGDAKDALAFWRGAGLIKTDVKRRETASVVPQEPPKPVRSADELPKYSGKQLSEIITRDNLASFVEACQEIYGKVLSTTDINILVGLREELHYDCETVYLILSHYGEKAKKPMKYIEKTAFSLFDAGLHSFEEVAAHIEKKRRIETREGHLRRLLGIGERALTSEEEKAFVRWCEEYNYDDSVIEFAYEQTVKATNKASVPYMDKIISRWNTAGCKTLADVHALSEKEKAERSSAAKPKSEKQAEKDEMRSFEVDDFFSHALDRSYGKKD